MKFEHCTRNIGMKLDNTLDVSSRGLYPFNKFSPFNSFKNIPHPLDKDILCDSVEAIWQGSKVFNAKDPNPDYYMLFGKKSFKKNKGKKPLGHWGGKGQPIIRDVGDARRKIYIPAYEWVLDNYLKSDVIGLFKKAAISDVIIYLYDFDSNDDIDNPAPLSHASVLVTYLNKRYDDWLKDNETQVIIAKLKYKKK